MNYPDDDTLLPSQHQVPPSLQDEPHAPTEPTAVPEDLKKTGHDTNESAAIDSPESLDQDISDGSDRERIDPHHSSPRMGDPTPGYEETPRDRKEGQA